MGRLITLVGTVLLSALCLSSGCASGSRNTTAATLTQREWRWERCYEGPLRSLDEITVLLVSSDPLALRVNSVDGEDVHEASEYHLLPGYHVVVTQPVSRGTLTTTSDPATVSCTLEAGTVYGLTADVAWDQAKYEANYWGSSFSQTFQWSPRTQALGSCSDVARRLASDEVRAQPGEKPPEHWRSTVSAEPSLEGGAQAACAHSSAAQSDWDIAEALKAGVVDPEATGAGISLVSLRVKRRIDQPVRVTVPVGTVFACRGSAQSMIALAAAGVDLRDDTWHTLTVPAAYIDLGRSVPQPTDTFMIQGWAHQKDLRKLMAFISRDAWPPGVQPQNTQQAVEVLQAAIWIVASNANYEALGVLRNMRGTSALLEQLASGVTPEELRGVRLIDETDAAMAVRLVDATGIDITQKLIWRDRQLIARGVSGPALRNWIERR